MNLLLILEAKLNILVCVVTSVCACTMAMFISGAVARHNSLEKNLDPHLC